MRISLLLLIFISACTSIRKPPDQTQILGEILLEIIQSSENTVSLFNETDFTLSPLPDSLDAHKRAIYIKRNHLLSSYLQQHGKTIAVRLGSPLEISGLILQKTGYTALDTFDSFQLNIAEKEAYDSFCQIVEKNIQLDFSKVSPPSGTTFNDKPLRFFYSGTKDSPAMRDYGLSPIGWSTDYKMGCFYFEDVGPLRGWGGLIFIQKEKNGWEISRREVLFVA